MLSTASLLKYGSPNSSSSYETMTRSTDIRRRKAKTRWMLIGFGQSVEVKTDENEENRISSEEKETNLDSFYDPICNLGIGRKGGLIQYLRMVGQEAKLRKGQLNVGQENTDRTQASGTLKLTVRLPILLLTQI